MKYVLSYDIGTTGVKTCVFSIDKTIKLVASASRGYPLYILEGGGAEQDVEDWWRGMCESTKEVFEKLAGASNSSGAFSSSGTSGASSSSGASVVFSSSGASVVSRAITPSDIAGISFCSQMQGVILVDKDGVPVHRPLSYMDQRAKAEYAEGMGNGLQVAGANIFKLLPSLIITGAASTSVKDPIWRCKWIEKNEPENFARAAYWLDVKDYLISRCTGEFKVTHDSAFATFLYDTREGREGWSKKMIKMMDIHEELLPPIVKSTDVVGGLTEKAAAELGLAPGTPVFGGGGDSSLIGVGAGAVKPGDTHIYSGTSGWVNTVLDKRAVDINYMIAAITGVQQGRFNYFAEMETAGKSIEWAKKMLFEGGVPSEAVYKGGEADAESSIAAAKPSEVASTSSGRVITYDELCERIKVIKPGCDGILFAPWLHGNRCPFEDSTSTGTYIGLKLETTRDEMFRATVEGVFYHLRWMLECEEKKIKTSGRVRFVGGSARSPYFCQMLADILGRPVETVASPHNVGSFGAAAIMAVGLGIVDSIDDIATLIPVDQTYQPDAKTHVAYEKYYQEFKKLYKSNKGIFKKLS